MWRAMSEAEKAAALAISPEQIRYPGRPLQARLAMALCLQAQGAGRHPGEITDKQAMALWRIVQDHRQRLPAAIAAMAQQQFAQLRQREQEQARAQQIAQDQGLTAWYRLDKPRRDLWRILNPAERLEKMRYWPDMPFWERIPDPFTKFGKAETFTNERGEPFTVVPRSAMDYLLARGEPVRLGLPGDGHE